jgi:hypothetical protein
MKTLCIGFRVGATGFSLKKFCFCYCCGLFLFVAYGVFVIFIYLVIIYLFMYYLCIICTLVSNLFHDWFLFHQAFDLSCPIFFVSEHPLSLISFLFVCLRWFGCYCCLCLLSFVYLFLFYLIYFVQLNSFYFILFYFNLIYEFI